MRISDWSSDVCSSDLLAERQWEDPEKARVCLAAAREGVERGLKLTSRLLDFAKPHEVDVRGVDANDCIIQLASFLKYGAGPDVRLMFDLAPVVPVCLLDPPQFRAAILNLLITARDPMPNGVEVRILTATCELKAAATGLTATR